MADLLPCPFCGSTDLKSGGDDKVVATWCLGCEATGPNQYGKVEWNTRASPTLTITEDDGSGDPLPPGWKPPQDPQTLPGMIAAVYGSLDAEDCAMVDRAWAKQRGYILPTDGTRTVAQGSISRGVLLAKITNDLLDWLDRPGYSADTVAEIILADIESASPPAALPAGVDHPLGRLWKAIEDNSTDESFWMAEILLHEITKETGYSGYAVSSTDRGSGK